MTWVKIYNTLLDIFQGFEHDEDTTVNATAVSSPTVTPSRTSKPFNNAMLPSLLCAKVDHTSFNNWKALSEKDRRDWPTIQ
eukprot:10608257-Ditylum_brightwellii.AAC.1